MDNKKIKKSVKSVKSESVASKILEDIAKQMDKEIETGCIIRYDKISEVEGISTGNLSIDQALGIGGIPKGRITEIYGPESSGKTSLALNIIAQVQKKYPNKVAAYIDMEHAIHPGHVSDMGVNLKELAFSQPSTAENALNLAYELACRGDVSIIVIDSVPSLVPKDVVDKKTGEVTVGLVARLLTSFLSKLNPISSKTETTIVFINQLRDKIGFTGFGEKENTPGGRALKFYSSVRIDLRKMTEIKVDGSLGEDKSKSAIGQIVKVRIKKNKCAMPFKVAEVDLIFGSGFCYKNDVFNIALKNKIIKQSGAWFYFEEERIGQGKMKTLDYVKENNDLFKKIEKRVIDRLAESSISIVDEEIAELEEEIEESEILAILEPTEGNESWDM